MGGCDLSSDISLPSALKAYATENKIPLTAAFELTPFCNFSCVMCYVRLTGKQAKEQGRPLTAAEWIDVAKQAREKGTLYLTLTGGEPLTRPDFWEIYSNLCEMGFLISLLSNGSLIDESVIDNFRKYGMPYQIKLSLYGASEETYEKVCGNHEGFEKIRHAVELIKAESIPLSMTATVIKENADDLKAMYMLAKKWGVPFQHTISVVKSARGAVNSAEKSRFAFDEFLYEMTPEQIEKTKLPPLKNPFDWCAGKNNSFWLTWNGHLQLCSFMNGPYATLENGLEAAWNELNRKLDSIKNPKECSQCEYAEFCQRCPGILCGESGSCAKISEDFCNTAKKLYEIYIKNNEGGTIR